MRTKVAERDGVRFLELTTPSDDPLEIVTAAIEASTGLVLFHDGALPAAFCDLSTGVAGEVLQKLVNYHLKAAAVFASLDGYSDRFKEFVAEARRGTGFRVFDDAAAAEAWLCS